MLGADLRAAEGGRAHRAQGRRAGVRPGQGDVSAGPLRQGHVPELRGSRAVRGQLRGVRCDLQPGGPRRRGVGAVGREARSAYLGALFRTSGGFRDTAAAVARGRRPGRAPSGAGGDRQQAGRVVRRRPAGLGHLARRSVLRVRDPRRPREILLRLAGRADRIHGQLQAPVRAARGPRLRRRLDPGFRGGALPFRGQGHRVLPHPVLARHAARSGLPHAHGGVRARLPHRQRPEDVEADRHLRQGPHVSRSPRSRVPALLLRVQAVERNRRSGPELRRLLPAGERRSRRQGREHRLAVLELHQPALRRPAVRAYRGAGSLP